MVEEQRLKAGELLPGDQAEVLHHSLVRIAHLHETSDTDGMDGDLEGLEPHSLRFRPQGKSVIRQREFRRVLKSRLINSLPQLRVPDAQGGRKARRLQPGPAQFLEPFRYVLKICLAGRVCPMLVAVEADFLVNETPEVVQPSLMTFHIEEPRHRHIMIPADSVQSIHFLTRSPVAVDAKSKDIL